MLCRDAPDQMTATVAELTEWIESGKFEKWAKQVGEWMTSAVNHILAFFDTVPAVIKAFSSAGDKLPEIIMEAMKSGATILGVGLVEYLVAAKEVFFGLGKIIGGAIMEMLLNSDLPGMGRVRNNAARKALANMTPEQATAQGLDPFLAGKQDRMLSPETARARERSIDDLIENGLSDSQKAKMGMPDANGLMIEGLRQAYNAFPTAAANTAATAAAEGRRMNGVVKDATNLDIGGKYNRNLLGREAEDKDRGKKIVIAALRSRVGPLSNDRVA